MTTLRPPRMPSFGDVHGAAREARGSAARVVNPASTPATERSSKRQSGTRALRPQNLPPMRAPMSSTIIPPASDGDDGSVPPEAYAEAVTQTGDETEG